MTGVTLASLAGYRVTEARLAIPAWGASYADVTVDGAVTLAGAVVLVLADMTVQGTVLAGGPAGDAGRSYFRVVAGAGGWAKTVSARSYANDAGVKLITVLGDVAAAAGEMLDTTTIDATATLGPYFVRAADTACRLLEQISPGAWYVGEDGKTRLGARPATTFATAAPRTSELDLARGTLTIASPTIAGIVPGLTIDGLTAVDVEHEFSEKGGLRSRVWGKQAGGSSRRLTALRRLVEQLDPDRRFRGVWEYRVVTQDGERLNLQPVRVSTGMPDLRRVLVRGALGIKAQHALGSRVLVGFVDADPARPAVLGFDDPESGGFVPISLALAGGGAPIGRVGDSVSVSFVATDAAAIVAPGGGSGGPCTLPGGTLTLTGQITAGSPKVTSG